MPLPDQMLRHEPAARLILQANVGIWDTHIPKVAIHKHHGLLALAADLPVILGMEPGKHQAIHVPGLHQVNNLLHRGGHMEHHIIPRLPDAGLQGSHQLASKGVLEGIELLLGNELQYDANDMGAVLGQGPCAHIWDVVIFPHRLLHQLDGRLGYLPGLAVDHVGNGGGAYIQLLGQLFYGNHGRMKRSLCLLLGHILADIQGYRHDDDQALYDVGIVGGYAHELHGDL